MILPYQDILKAIERDNLIENVSMDCISTNGYDLRIGSYSTGKSKQPIFLERDGITRSIEVPANQPTRLGTIEVINMPNDLCGKVYIRSSYDRDGVLASATSVEAGYSGTLTITVQHTMKNRKLEFKYGTRIAQLQFEYLAKPVTKGYEYGGDKLGHKSQYQGSYGATASKLAQTAKSTGKRVIEVGSAIDGLSALATFILGFTKR